MDLRKSLNGKPKATSFWQRSRLRLAVKRNGLSAMNLRVVDEATSPSNRLNGRTRSLVHYIKP